VGTLEVDGPQVGTQVGTQAEVATLEVDDPQVGTQVAAEQLALMLALSGILVWFLSESALFSRARWCDLQIPRFASHTQRALEYT